MCPYLPAFNSRNGRLVYFESGSQNILPFIGGQDGKNIIFGKFGLQMLFASWWRLFDDVYMSIAIFLSFIRPNLLRITCASFSGSIVLTSDANSAAGWWPVDVLSNKRVAILAMCLSGAFCGKAFTSQDIFSLGHRLQMARIDAASISTEMIYDKAIWNKADTKDIGQPMSHRELSATSVGPAISIVVFSARINPALIGFMRSLEIPEQPLEPEIFHLPLMSIVGEYVNGYVWGNDLT